MKTHSTHVAAETLFKALADRTRLRLLHLLFDGELCVCHLVQALDLPQPTASRHLAYLRRAGLVLRRRDAQWFYYRLAPASGKFHAQLLACVRLACRELPEVEEDRQRLSGKKRGCCE